MYSYRRLQHGRGKIRPRARAVHPPADMRDGCGRDSDAHSRAVPDRAYSYFRRGERERVLYRVRGEMLQNISVHDDTCLHQQGGVHLPAGDGQGGRFDRAVDDKRNSFRRRAGACTPARVGARRSNNFDACGGYSRIYRFGDSDNLYLPHAEKDESRKLA